MANVTGKLSDFGLQALKEPRLLFTASEAGVKAGRLFASTPVAANVLSDGTFTVSLEPTDGVTPEVFYTVSVEHLQASGTYTHFDVLGLKIFVPITGGVIGDLPGIPLSPYYVLVSLDPPPVGYVGWYLNAGLGDPDNVALSGTGILEMVS